MSPLFLQDKSEPLFLFQFMLQMLIVTIITRYCSIVAGKSNESSFNTPDMLLCVQYIKYFSQETDQTNKCSTKREKKPLVLEISTLGGHRKSCYALFVYPSERKRKDVYRHIEKNDRNKRPKRQKSSAEFLNGGNAEIVRDTTAAYY